MVGWCWLIKRVSWNGQVLCHVIASAGMPLKHDERLPLRHAPGSAAWYHTTAMPARNQNHGPCHTPLMCDGKGVCRRPCSFLDANWQIKWQSGRTCSSWCLCLDLRHLIITPNNENIPLVRMSAHGMLVRSKRWRIRYIQYMSKYNHYIWNDSS